MMIFLMIIHVMACLLLIAVILLQAGRGHGLAGGTFGGEMQTVLGTKTASFMSKVTTGCAISFIITCLAIDVLSSWEGRSLLGKESGKSPMTKAQVEEMIKNLKAEMDAKAPEATEAQAQVDAAASTSADAAIASASEALNQVKQEAVAVSGAVANSSREVVAEAAAAAKEALGE